MAEQLYAVCFRSYDEQQTDTQVASRVLRMVQVDNALPIYEATNSVYFWKRMADEFQMHADYWLIPVEE